MKGYRGLVRGCGVLFWEPRSSLGVVRLRLCLEFLWNVKFSLIDAFSMSIEIIVAISTRALGRTQSAWCQPRARCTTVSLVIARGKFKFPGRRPLSEHLKRDYCSF